MSDNEDELCQACAAYLAHYPAMADEWQCDHSLDEQAFMLALADAIHGPTPVGEFTDAGWRAAMFLDDAEVALSCGHAPYAMQITHNVEPWTFMALVNGTHLIGTRNDEGAQLEHIADIGWLGAATLREQLDEAEEKISILAAGCANLSRDELIQRITEVGPARYKAGYWLGERLRAERQKARAQAIEQAGARAASVNAEAARRVRAIAAPTEGTPHV